MKKLELEVTDELMGKIEAAAGECLVTPSHWATCKLKDIFLKKAALKWLPLTVPILESLVTSIKAVLLQSEEASQKSEQ